MTIFEFDCLFVFNTYFFRHNPKWYLYEERYWLSFLNTQSETKIYNFNQQARRRVSVIGSMRASSETHGRSVGSGEMAAIVFLRTGRRAPGMLLLRSQFHDPFESRCFRDLLIRRSLPAISTFRRTCLASTREPSQWKWAPQKLYNLAC